MTVEDFKKASCIVDQVLSKALSSKALHHHPGNPGSLPIAPASRVNKTIGTPASGSPNSHVDAAVSIGGQEASPERVTQKIGDRKMTTETKPKKKPTFNIHTKDAAGKRHYVTSIYPRHNGNGFQFRIDGKFYEIFPCKAKPETEEGA